MKKKENNFWKDWKTWVIIILAIVIFSNLTSQQDTWEYQICVSDCMSDNFDCSISKAVLTRDYGGYIPKLEYELCHYDLEECLYRCKDA